MAQTFDAVIWGGTASGLVAAKALSNAGYSSVVLEWTGQRGGLMTGGLGAVDGVRDTAWGITFGIWTDIVAEGAPYTTANVFGIPDVYMPSHARAVFADLIDADPNITVITDCWLEEVVVDPVTRKITSIITDVDTFIGEEWIDCSYEQDLARLAGVPLRWGRTERPSTYGEPSAGIHHDHQITINARAVTTRGDIYPGHFMPPVGDDGTADGKSMAFNYRMSFSSHASRLAWPQSAGYRREKMLPWITEMIDRNITTLAGISSYQMWGPDKGTSNGNTLAGPTSWNYAATRTRAAREAVWSEVQDYMADRYYAAANEPDSPALTDMALWGLPADENTVAGEYYRYPGWSGALYCREGPRIRGRVTVSEYHMVNGLVAAGMWPDPIGCAGYNADSHPCNRYPTTDLKRIEEGHMDVDSLNWQVPWDAIRPHAAHIINLQCPVGASVSRTGMTSLRIESTWMILGEAAGIAAAVALERGAPTGSLSYSTISPALAAAGAKLNP